MTWFQRTHRKHSKLERGNIGGQNRHDGKQSMISISEYRHTEWKQIPQKIRAHIRKHLAPQFSEAQLPSSEKVATALRKLNYVHEVAVTGAVNDLDSLIVVYFTDGSLRRNFTTTVRRTAESSMRMPLHADLQVAQLQF